MSRYDIDNSGEIDRGEMVRVMSSIYSMVDGNVSGAMRGGTEERASKHAENLFSHNLYKHVLWLSPR